MTEGRASTLQRLCFWLLQSFKLFMLLISALLTLGGGVCAVSPLYFRSTDTVIPFLIGCVCVVTFGLGCYGLLVSLRRALRDKKQMDDPDA
ncbi:hypothetical protein JCM19000A_07890 [Silvimonas sp. JCM 19000]